MRRRPALPRGAAWMVLALLPLVLMWPALRHTVESRMSLHMLGEFPMLFAAGWSAGRLRLGPLGSRRWLRAQRLLDWRGWTGAVLTSGVALVWMLPSALDAALMSPAAAAAKIVSWWLAGWWLADSWRRMDAELLLFFVGNLLWMAATAGLLYVDAPTRLCVNYLQDDQRHAGVGLVLLALLLGALTLRRAMGRQGPRVGKAPSGIIVRPRGGSKTMPTWALPMPNRGAVRVTLQTPVVAGHRRDRWYRPLIAGPTTVEAEARCSDVLSAGGARSGTSLASTPRRKGPDRRRAGTDVGIDSA